MSCKDSTEALGESVHYCSLFYLPQMIVLSGH